MNPSVQIWIKWYYSKWANKPIPNFYSEKGIGPAASSSCNTFIHKVGPKTYRNQTIWKSPVINLTSFALKHLPSRAQLPGPTWSSSSLHSSPSNIWANSTNIFGVNTCGFIALALEEKVFLLGEHVGESVQGLGELLETWRIEVLRFSHGRFPDSQLQFQTKTPLAKLSKSKVQYPSAISLGGIWLLESAWWVEPRCCRFRMRWCNWSNHESSDCLAMQCCGWTHLITIAFHRLRSQHIGILHRLSDHWILSGWRCMTPFEQVPVAEGSPRQILQAVHPHRWPLSMKAGKCKTTKRGTASPPAS